jgi:hypothetical protein
LREPGWIAAPWRLTRIQPIWARSVSTTSRPAPGNSTRASARAAAQASCAAPVHAPQPKAAQLHLHTHEVLAVRRQLELERGNARTKAAPILDRICSRHCALAQR